MGNPYLEAFRASGGASGGQGGSPAPASTSNRRLAAFRASQPKQPQPPTPTPQATPKPQQQPQNNQNWLQKGLAGVAKAFTSDLGKNVGDIMGVGKSMFVDPVANIAQQARLSTQIQQKNNGQSTVDSHFAQNQNAEIDRALKAGQITPQKATQLRAKTATAVNKTLVSVDTAQRNVGVKYDPSAGVQGIVDTVMNLGGTGELGVVGKQVFTKAVETAQKRLGRNLTTEEATNLAKATKQAVPEPVPHASEAGSMPAPTVKAEPTSIPVKTAEPSVVSAPVHPLQEPVSKSNSMKLGDILHNPDLFNKYPTLKDTEVHFTNDKSGLLSGGNGGSYTKLGDKGRISIGRDGWDYVPDNSKIAVAEAKKTALYEKIKAENDSGASEAELNSKYLPQVKAVEDELYNLKLPENAQGKVLNETGYSRLAHEIEHGKQHARGEEMSHTADYENRPHEKAAFDAQSKYADDIKNRIKQTFPTSSKQELKTAVDAHLYETHPELFHPKETGRVFNETGTGDIPSLHVDDIKQHFGHTEDIPAIYKRTTGPRNIDQLAQQAGYDDVDKFVSDIQDELSARKGARESTKKLAELRKDPEIIAQAQKNLDDERAQYGTPDTFTPSKKDLREATTTIHGDSAKPIKNKPSLTADEIDPQIKGNRNLKGDTQSGNSIRLEQNALEKKLTDKFGDLATYKSINMKEQAEKATKLVTEDRQKAIDIIDGKANPPGNLKEQSVHQALEDAAVKEGDGELLQKLAKSHVNTELSESAQNLRIAAERDPNSAVENIRQIQEARMSSVEKRTGTTVEKETKKAVEAVKQSTRITTKQDLAAFIKDLTC